MHTWGEVSYAVPPGRSPPHPTPLPIAPPPYQARPSPQFPKANILPGRQPCVALGRPDLAALLRDTGRRAAERGEARVAVMVCG